MKYLLIPIKMMIRNKAFSIWIEVIKKNIEIIIINEKDKRYRAILYIK